MFTRQWSTSERRYGVSVDRDVKVRMPDGVRLDGDIFRPDSDEKFPVILGAHAYNKNLQSPPMLPVGFTPRRGYVQAVFNVRGSGGSEGFYQLMGPQEVRDVCDLIDWLAAQPWSNGVVGMFGVSYFARLAKAAQSDLCAVCGHRRLSPSLLSRRHSGARLHQPLAQQPAQAELSKPLQRSARRSGVQGSDCPRARRRGDHRDPDPARGAAESRRRHQRADRRFYFAALRRPVLARA